MNYKQHLNCRVCGSENLIPYLDLGMMPLSNNLAESTVDKIHGEKYPLKVLLCENCGLSQLSIVIQPEVMFEHYVYRSSISSDYTNHCRAMSIDLQKKYNLGADSFHIDIAGNDGALLQEFKKVIGNKVLNVDPAKNLTAICETMGIATLSQFWGITAARTILNGGYGMADLITATNVFAHVDDVTEFIEAVKLVLKPTGVLVMEFPYLIDFIENKEFDTIYFEHLSYYSVHPLTLLCKNLGLQVMNVTKQEIHGGSIRVTIGYGASDETVDPFIMDELQYFSNIERYYQFARDVQVTIDNFRNGISHLSGTVAGFAASAKGNTLLNSCGITVGLMRYIVDETPEKIGKYSPGTHIPIIGLNDFIKNPPDYLVILSWNFKEAIIDKCRKAGYQGKFILPIPEFKIID